MLAKLPPQKRSHGVCAGFLVTLIFFLAMLVVPPRTNAGGATIQFDPFLGYDGIVPAASWFPLVCEIKNDGAAFNGVVEVTDAFGQGQKTAMVVELPTGTLKRVVLPLFAGSRGYRSYNIRLLDEKGKTRAEQVGVRPRKSMPSRLPLLCGLTRTAGGLPVVKQGLSKTPENQITTGRLQPALFPDNPLVLEGMNALYVNTERAGELNLGQVSALHAWLNEGGQLILGIEQAGDVAARPWLKDLIPCELGEFSTVTDHLELQRWLRRNQARSPENDESTASEGGSQGATFDDPSDPAFESSPVQLLDCGSVQARVLVSLAGKPAIIETPRGRGRVTVLLFSPEREPFRSWKNLPSFWAKIAGVPADYYASKNMPEPYYSSDSVFGALLDTRQVNKLPYHWLLLLLVVYLVVIGPLDMYWLRKIRRPMLTWITFPCYVVFFSLLIYFIGYMLRAGESEWNELHMVDVLPVGSQGSLRGRTYASVYSPSNQRFDLEGQQKFASFRPEFGGAWQGGSSVDKGTVLVTGDSYKAEMFVPVWTSQLMVSDWWQPGVAPLKVKLKPNPGGFSLSVENSTGRRLKQAQLLMGREFFDLGEIPPGAKDYTLNESESRAYGLALSGVAARFRSAVEGRRQAFGGAKSGRLEDPMITGVAISVLSSLDSAPNNQNRATFLVPPGVDLTPSLEEGSAFLLAWDEGHSPTKSIHRFTPKRSSKNTLWRVLVE